MQSVTEAFDALANPRSIDSTHAVNVLIVSGVAFAFLFVCDKLVARRFRRPYMVLHLIANTIITWLTLVGSLRALTYPSASTLPGEEGPVSQVFLAWIYAIHIYHPIFFKTNVMDWIHHTPVYLLNTAMFSVLSGPVFQLQGLILTGFPGGLDYLLQALEGEGLLSRGLYKELASSINVYVRAPLGFVSGYICLVGLWHHSAESTVWQSIVFIGMGVHACWNAPFFGRQAIEANIVDIVNRFSLVGGSLKLPRVRAFSGRSAEATKEKGPSPATSEKTPSLQ